MKLSRFFSYTISLALAFISFLYAESDSADEVMLDPNQCYYWMGLHGNELYKYESDQLQALIAEVDEEVIANDSRRKRAILLLSARLNRVEIGPETLAVWMSNLTGTPERETDEDNLIHEVVMTLGAQGLKSELQHLLSSESLPVREEAFSALLFYADQSDLASMRELDRERTKSLKAEAQEVVEAYKSDPLRGAELGRQLAEKSKFAPSAVGQLRDYFAYQSYEKPDEGWLRMIGKDGLLKMRSTATNQDVYRRGSGGYLEDSLTNRFFLQKLDEIFKKASSQSERLELERVFRDASAESGIADEIYNTPLFYLLGFELTDEERAYLLREAGLSENQILPAGQIHLIGYELENLQTLPRITSLIAPKVEVVARESAPLEPIFEKSAEVVTSEPIEEPANQPSQWWLWLIGLVAVLGLVLRSKS